MTTKLLIENKFLIHPCDGKKPITKNWNNLSKSVKIINNYNTGIITGKVSNITIVDIDIKDNGLETWNKLINEFGDINTVKVKTPSGGLHYYFKYNDQIKKNITKLNEIGIDIKNDGGNIISPPSIGYTYINHLDTYDIINIPEWLLNYILSANNIENSQNCPS